MMLFHMASEAAPTHWTEIYVFINSFGNVIRRHTQSKCHNYHRHESLRRNETLFRIEEISPDITAGSFKHYTSTIVVRLKYEA